MAKPTTLKIKLMSTAGTGFYYVTRKNPRTQTEKLADQGPARSGAAGDLRHQTG